MGYSFTGTPTDGFVPLQTDHLQNYDIMIDLLGLRDLRLPPGSFGALFKAGLQISSYWEEPVDLDITDQELPNPNFRGDLPAKSEWSVIAKTVEKCMKVVETIEDEAEAETGVEAQDADKSSGYVPKV